MKDYERLTVKKAKTLKLSGGIKQTITSKECPPLCSTTTCQMCQNNVKMLNSLVELEDKIESGKLVELPVGWLDALKLLTCATMCYADIDNMIASGMQNSQELADLFMKIPRVQGSTLQWSLQDLANSKLDCNKIAGFEEVLNAMPKFKARVQEAAKAKLAEVKGEK